MLYALEQRGNRMSVKVAAFTKDLMFSSRIREAANGTEVAFARSPDDLRTIAEAHSPALVIFDLADNDSPEAFDFVKSALPQVVCAGYYPHVDKEIAERFKKLGCDEVMPKSRFVREVKGLIEGVGQGFCSSARED